MSNRALMVGTLATAMMAGCGGGGPRLVPVSGTVTHGGKPLEGAEVTFIPDGSNPEGLPGNDVTGRSGHYRATTQGRRGLVPGKYHVTVKKITINDPSGSAGGPNQDPRMTLELELAYAHQVALKTGKKPALPSFIQTVEGSFEREVPPGGGVIDLAVEGEAAKGPRASK
jgi:hypothetical protein